MCLAFHWFYLKSRSLLLVYRDAISDSYTFFYPDALQKLLLNLQLCVNTHQIPCFLDLRVFAGVLRIFAGFLRGILVALFLFFADSVQKVL